MTHSIKRNHPHSVRTQPWRLPKRAILALSAMLFGCPVLLRTPGGNSIPAPKFACTGSYVLEMENGTRSWTLRLLTSGTLTFDRSMIADVCLVGGGGGPSRTGSYQPEAGNGGYVTNHAGVVLEGGVAYPVVIGAGGAASTGTSSGGNGGNSSAFGLVASGGDGGVNSSDVTTYGGSGGAGRAGVGGTNGADGTGTYHGCGAGTSTYEFGESARPLYASGGNALTLPVAKLENTGNGGDCAVTYGVTGTNGASGIIIVRNVRSI